MARIASFTSAGTPTGPRSTLAELMARKKLLAEQQGEIVGPRPIEHWMQGVGQLAQAFVNARQQSAAAEELATGREELAGAMSGIDWTKGPSPEQLQTITALDPDAGQRIMEQSASRALEELKYKREQEEKAATPLTDIAKLNADLKAGRIDQATYDALVTKATTPEAKEPPGFGPEQDLRKEYTALPVIKNLPTVQTALERVKAGAAADDPIGDMALIYGFMKLQDPESVVREGEYATAENARGVGDTLRNLYNRVKDGVRLTPEQRQQFIQMSQSQYEGIAAQVGEVNKRYSGIASQYGIDPSRIIVLPKTYDGGQAEPAPEGDEGGTAAPATYKVGETVTFDDGTTATYKGGPIDDAASWDIKVKGR